MIPKADPPVEIAKSDLNPEEYSTARPRILLADTNRWAIAARLAIEFRNLGCDVAIVCRMPGHPARVVPGIERIFPYSGRAPLQSLRNAIEAFDPDVIVPSCDRDVQQLHDLHAASESFAGSNKQIAALIERSLGAPDGFRITSSRYELLKLAESEGICVPKQMPIECERDLERWYAQSEPTWVMKADGTSEGKGVRFVSSVAEAKQFFFLHSKRAGVLKLWKNLMLFRDRDWVRFDWKQGQRAVIAQSIVQGRPANCAVVCWRGRVLAGVAVEAIKTRGRSGPATLVQVVEGAEMLAAAAKIAGRLGISGFFGLDFLIETGSDIPYLIEMNPRCTTPCTLPLGEGRNLAAAFWSQLTGRPIRADLPVIRERFIAYFPTTAERSGSFGDAHQGQAVHHDIPQDAPELVRELRHPWPARTFVGRLIDRVRQRKLSKMEPTAAVEDVDSFSKEYAVKTLQQESSIGSPEAEVLRH